VGLVECPHCKNAFNKEIVGTQYHDIFPYAMEYYCPECKTMKIKKVSADDLAKFKQDFKEKLLDIPLTNETKRLIAKGITNFAQILSPRQIITFNSFLDGFRNTPYEEISKVMVSNSLRACSYLAYYSPRYRKVIPGFVIKSYWLPIQPVELNPLAFKVDSKGELFPLGRGNIISSYRKMVRANKWATENKYNLKNVETILGDAREALKNFKKKVDVVFTDPPYANYQFYSDLSLFSTALTDKDDFEKYVRSLIDGEISMRDKNDLNNYKKGIFETFRLVKRLLKDEGRVIVTFHHTDINIVTEFLDVFKRLSFGLEAVYTVLGESSGNLIKRRIYLDYVFVFSKYPTKHIHHVDSDIYFTESDEKMIKLIPSLIKIWEECYEIPKYKD